MHSTQRPHYEPTPLGPPTTRGLSRWRPYSTASPSWTASARWPRSTHCTARPRSAVAYSTVKAGLLGLTRSLAGELGPYGICVTTVLPGAIEVEAETAIPSHHRARPEDQINRQCVPRRGRPEDVAALWCSS
ncbi:SDR family oxidoreductase [Streptomyces xanthophaeus]